MKKFFLFVALSAIALTVSAKQKAPPLTNQNLVSNDAVFVMPPVCQSTSLVTVDPANTQNQMVYGVTIQKSSSDFIQSSKRSAGAVPLTIMEGLVTKKELAISSSFNSINTNWNCARNKVDFTLLNSINMRGGVNYILKHPLIVSVNNQIEVKVSGMNMEQNNFSKKGENSNIG
jgi:hypothetical protein